MSKIQTAFSAIFPTGNLRVQVVLWEFWNSTQFCFFSFRINCYNQILVNAPFGGYKQSGFGKDL